MRITPGMAQVALQTHRLTPALQNQQERFGTRLRDMLKHGTAVRGLLQTAAQHTARLQQQQRAITSVQQTTHGTAQLVLQTQELTAVQQNLQQEQHGILFQATLKHGTVVRGVLLTHQQAITLAEVQQHVVSPVMQITPGMAQPVLQTHRLTPALQNQQERFGTRLLNILKHGTAVRGLLLTAIQHTARLQQQQRAITSVQQTTHGTVQIVLQIQEHTPVQQNLQTLHGIRFQATLKHGMAVHGRLLTVQQHTILRQQRQRVIISAQAHITGVVQHV